MAATKAPEIGSAFVPFNTRTPHVYADFDRTKAEVLGVADSNVFEALQIYLSPTLVNDFNLFGRSFKVVAQAESTQRGQDSAITDLRVRSKAGAMVPLGSLLTLKHVTGPYRIYRYNLFPSAEVQGEAASGVSSGEAIRVMERVSRDALPTGFGVEWTDLSYQEKVAGHTGEGVFALGVAFVFLVLAAFYEGLALPFAVILIVPMCLLAALAGVALVKGDNNILTQIGMVALIGLAAKNSILIVEFARQGQQQRGLSAIDAAVEAGRTRLRPILMTSIAFILGVAPLAFARGAGAEMRRALGTTVFFGMIGVTVFGVIFTPVFFVVCRNISDVVRRRRTMAVQRRPRQAAE